MKIALAQLNYIIGDFEGNKAKIAESIVRARAEGARVLAFAELAVCGTPALDLTSKVTFIEMCEEVLEDVAALCDDITVIVGLPLQHGLHTSSAAAVIQNGRVIRYVGRKVITRRSDRDYFVPSNGVEYVMVDGVRIAVAVGEDITLESDLAAADIIINPISQCYMRRIIERRYAYYSKAAYTLGKHVIYVNQVGGSTDVVFDGASAVFNPQGEPVALLKSFEEDFRVVDLADTEHRERLPRPDKMQEVYGALTLGLRDFFVKNGFTKACIGMSGGIDSAVVAAIAADVLGPENLRFLMLPSQFSSDHSVEDAVAMAEILGVEYNVVPITEAYKSITECMMPVLGGMPFDVTEENIQARIRCTMLMALSNKYGYVLLNTSNKSEEAVGYGTLYGDTVGAISILGDLYKREVYELARYINRNGVVIPENILVKEPSAELRPEQKDTDMLPPYDVVDAILYRMIEEGQHREEIINAGFDAEVVEKIHAMILKNEPKRYQFCPVLRLSTCTLGKGRVMPLTHRYGF